jgi:hypothetical protein
MYLIPIFIGGTVLAVAAFFDGCLRAVRIFMTRTRTVAQLSDSVFGTFVFFVLTRLEIIGMTACTIRLVGRGLPNYGLRIARVTFLTIIKAPVSGWE